MRFCALILLCCLSGGAAGEDRLPLWFADLRQEQAAREIEGQLAILAAADLDPRFADLHGRLRLASGPREASPLYTEAYLMIQAFWRETYRFPPGQLEFDEPLALLPQPGFATTMAHDAAQGRLYERVLALEPPVPYYLAFSNRLRRLEHLALQPAPEISAWGLIKPGEHHQEIPAIRTQLARLGDYPGRTDSLRYDAGLVAAVEQFQRRHGLKADGVIGPKTRRWLRIDYRERARLLARAMVRQAHDRHYFAPDHLLVNIPDYRLDWVQAGQSRFRARVVVGMPTRRTPRMHSELHSVVVNPYWNVPRSILRKDLLPRILTDGSYVRRNGFEVLDQENRTLWLSPDELSRLAFQGFPYRLRQKPGPGNALGRYKFHLVNSQAIYLHDTPKQRLFDQSHRAFSSGCIRVQNAELLANLLLQAQSPSGPPLSRYVGASGPRWLTLNQPLAVYMVYWSAWMEQGLAQYRDDIYDLDRRVTHQWAESTN
ncbi:murein L,D-transpeptidase [Ferrimonas balearica]|uniref:L,D-transpeptidase family protein n=1 Tax=Ferrimonas balearica TaxID=44012 RepID=UPI001C99052B|nr:L,D-transpeptidase family protein [Ferrimonas balearica]MBY5920914.1 L,D-transpeptidase family protein [Ferrimonas balearica]MBY5996401.1 L,D-transpeptidase family protein [Ferrimonas balearica]